MSAIASLLAPPTFADVTSGILLTASDQPLASRLPASETAGEYWDVTAWFDSGDRFFARFLITNQGPGVRSAAAVGHLFKSDEWLVPFKWGRRDGGWTLAADGRRLTIGKATLDVSGPRITVRIDSKKHGLDLALEIEAGSGIETFRDSFETFAVAMPTAARGTLNGDDPSTKRQVLGSAAVVHRWGDRPETERVNRRDEIFARRNDVALYVMATTASDGTRRGAYELRRSVRTESSTEAGPLSFAGDLLPGSDTGYPVAREWRLPSPSEVDARATLTTPLLRVNPLNVLPQPFRFLLALGGTPQRVWAPATVRVGTTEPVELDGIAVTSFARPER